MESAQRMAAPVMNAEETQSTKSRNTLLITQICLRLLCIAATLAATVVMVTSKQSAVVFGIPVDARYTYCSAFKFSAFANAVACAFCVLSLFFFIIIHRCPGMNPSRYNFLFLHDLLMMSLVLASSAAATSIGLLGKQGNSHTGWMPICDHFGTFCNKVTTSIVLSFFSSLLLVALTLISASNNK